MCSVYIFNAMYFLTEVEEMLISVVLSLSSLQILKQPLNSGHPATPYNGLFSHSQLYPNNTYGPWFAGHGFSLRRLCTKDRCGFLFVHYKRHCCTELVSWGHSAGLLSGIKKRLLEGGWVNTSSVIISISATASVRYREVVCLWEGLFHCNITIIYW